MAREMTLGLAEEGFVIVSGMARGIDTLAHDAAIKAGARTLAVLGAGLDWIYPPENASLAKSIARHGALITEFPMGKAPHATHFPRRNRLISALSLGALVVEAGNDSGALITADYALDQGREVFAIPGAVQHPGTRGTHKLIREGAHLVERAADIVAVLAGLTQAVPMRRFASPERNRILASGPGPAGRKGLSAPARQASLPLSREPAATGATPEARPGQGDAGAAVVPSDFHPDSVSGEPSGSLDEESRALLSFLDRQGRTLEVIAEKARGRPGWTEAKPQRLLSGLLALELKGRVRRMPGALFRLR
jgi:DNA processing protein